MRSVVYVDGNALLHSAWHGYPESYDLDGNACQAILGFLSKMHRLDRDYQWDSLIIVFDPAEGSLYRKSIFPDYKAHRPAPDPDFVRQKILLEELLPSLGFDILKVPGVESDDVIGTLAKKAAAAGDAVMVVTPDKDMCQLIDDSIGILRPLRGQEAIGTPFDYVDSSGVLSRFGVAPALIPDWLALIGDVSDNIPGVDGVGPKTATKLLQEYGDLRTLMTHSKGIKGKVGEALREASSFYEVSLKLTTIQTTLASDGWVVIPGAASIDKIESIAATYQMPSWMGRFLFLSDLFPAEGA